MIRTEDLSSADVLTAISLQGIANARAAHIYLDPGPADPVASRLLNILRTLHNVTTTNTSLSGALTDFASEVKGIVVYDAAVPDTINVATTIAGIDHAILVDASAAPTMARRLGLPILEDLSQLPWAGLSRLALYRLAESRYLGQTNLSVLGYLEPDQLGPRDYLIAARSFVFYSQPGPYADSSETGLLDEILGRVPAGGAVLGWAPDETGAEENFLVQAISRHGCFLVGAESTPNLSLLSAFRAASPLAPHVPSAPPSLGNQTYVAFAIPDGDNLDFIHSRLLQLWNETERGSLPIAWSVTPALAELAPAYLELLYDESSPQDEFLAGPSGAGLAFPGLMPPEGLNAFLRETKSLSEEAGLDLQWVLDGYRTYEIPYPNGLLDAYQDTLSPRGLLLDYGDRPVSYEYGTIGDTPTTRSTHYWGTEANLLAKVGLDTSSGGGPHFLVVVLYPYTKNLADLVRVAQAIEDLSPGRVQFVGLHALFALEAQATLSWAERLASEVHQSPLPRLMDPTAVASGDASREAGTPFEAVQDYQQALAASDLVAMIALVTAIAAIALVLFRRNAPLLSLGVSPKEAARAAMAIAAIALVVASANQILDRNFWDYPALVLAWALTWIVRPVFRRVARWDKAAPLVAAALLVGGAGLLNVTSWAIVPLIAASCAVVTATASPKEGRPLPMTLTVAVGALLGWILGGLAWTPVVLAGGLIVAVLAGLWKPVPDAPARRARFPASVGLPVLVSLSVMVLALPVSAFYAIHLDWNLSLVLSFVAVVLAFGLPVGWALGALSRLPAGASVGISAAMFLAGAFLGGLSLILATLLGFIFLGAASYALESEWRERSGVQPGGTAILALVLLLVAIERIQPVYYSVYLWPLPGTIETVMYATPVLMAGGVALAGALTLPWRIGPRHTSARSA